MNTDPIADMLTRIRNAVAAKQDTTPVPYSKIKEAIAVILAKHGFITGYKVDQNGAFKVLRLDLSEGPRTKVSSLVRISKPGRRVYANSTEIPAVLGGRGIVIISTSSGLMTGQEARKRGLGGELICKVY